MIARMKVFGVAAAAMTLATTVGAVDQQSVGAEAGLPPANAGCRPVYPVEALRTHAQGVTTLAFHVDAKGEVTQVDIMKRSGSAREHKLLDEAAAYGLASCPFKAGEDADGNPIATVVKVAYAWRIE